MSQLTVRTYGGWQRDRSAFLFGLTVGRALMCGAAMLLVIVTIGAHTLTVALLAIPLAVLLVGLAFFRVAGRTASEWVSDASRFAVGRRRGHTRFTSGAMAPRDPEDPAGPPPMDLPGALAPLRFLTSDTGTGGTVGVVHHPLDDTYTIIARVHGGGLSLADSVRRDARVGGWGGVLASLCTETNPFVRVQACLRSVPGDTTALRRWHDEHLAPDAPALALANMAEVLSSGAPAGSQDDGWLAFTMSAARAKADIRGAGGGDAAACAVAWRRVRAMEQILREASIIVEEWLDVRGIAEVIRTGFDPGSRPVLAARRHAAQASLARGAEHTGLAAGVDPALAGPAAAETSWTSYRHDTGVSVSYAVHEWPRSEVFASFLTPLLSHSAYDARRSFSLYIEPLGPRAARRKITVEATKAETAMSLQRKTGKVVSMEDQMARRRIAEQDLEQTAGHGLVRFQGYITVTVDDPVKLNRATTDLESDAAAARIELRRMVTQQDVGFFASVLPLGMGMPMPRAR